MKKTYTTPQAYLFALEKHDVMYVSNTLTDFDGGNGDHIQYWDQL